MKFSLNFFPPRRTGAARKSLNDSSHSGWRVQNLRDDHVEEGQSSARCPARTVKFAQAARSPNSFVYKMYEKVPNYSVFGLSFRRSINTGWGLSGLLQPARWSVELLLRSEENT